MPKWIGALIPAVSLVFATTAVAQTPSQTPRASGTTYAINDFVLGARISADSAPYRDYRCGPSEQFDGFTWCQRSRQERERRGSFSANYSILHSRDGKIAYINRQQIPAFFDTNEVDEDIRFFSRKIGSQPRITRMPRRPGTAEGVLAVWGQVEIEPLDSESTKILADGKSPKKGFLVDFVGNLNRSAQDGLPIYRITGGAGLIWVASYDQRGRGTLRITAVDTSALPSMAVETTTLAATATPVATPAVEPSNQSSSPQTPPAEAKEGGTGDNARGAERIEIATQVQAGADAAPSSTASATEEVARIANERPAAGTERFAMVVSYVFIGGLLLLLMTVLIRLSLMKGRKRAANKTSTGISSAGSVDRDFIEKCSYSRRAWNDGALSQGIRCSACAARRRGRF